MDYAELVQKRRAVSDYDPEHVMTDEELAAIFEKVTLTPSSYNLQHWRFVVVRDRENKRKLCEAAFKQPKVELASATVVVVGRLAAFRDAERIYAALTPDKRAPLIRRIEATYEGKPAFQRDEAIRSAAMAAMNLMLAALDAGYESGPMIGFDPQAVARLVGLDDDHIPVMLVTLGKQVGSLRPRPARLPISEIVHFERLDGRGLSAER